LHVRRTETPLVPLLSRQEVIDAILTLKIMHDRQIVTYQSWPQFGILRITESALVEIHMPVSYEIVEIADNMVTYGHSDHLHLIAGHRVAHKSLMKAAREFGSKGSICTPPLPVKVVQLPKAVEVFDSDIH